jgi:DNA-binding transcriptional ArsR family regulator
VPISVDKVLFESYRTIESEPPARANAVELGLEREIHTTMPAQLIAAEAEKDNSEQLVEVFRALGDPTRLEMMRMITRDGEVACTTFLERFGVTKSTISYHVRILRTAQLVRIRKEGTYYFYRLATALDELPGMADALAGDSRLAR